MFIESIESSCYLLIASIKKSTVNLIPPIYTGVKNNEGNDIVSLLNFCFFYSITKMLFGIGHTFVCNSFTGGSKGFLLTTNYFYDSFKFSHFCISVSVHLSIPLLWRAFCEKQFRKENITFLVFLNIKFVKICY